MSLGIFFKQLLYKKASRDMDIPAVSNFKDVKIKVGDIVDLTKSEISIPEASVIELTGVSNTAGAYTASNVLTALDREVIYLFKPSADSAVASTLNVDSLGILPLKQFDGTTIVPLTELKAENTYSLIFKDTYWLVNGGGGGGSAKFKSDIIVKNAGYNFGKYPNPSVVPAAGKTVDEVFALAFTLETFPTYNPPSASWNTDNGNYSNGEIGSVVAGNFSINFTQNDAGVRTAQTLNASGGLTTTSLSLPFSYIRTASNQGTGSGTVSYNATNVSSGPPTGQLKYTNLGNPWPTGFITAGTIGVGGSIQYIGYYKIFVGRGPVNPGPGPSSTVRSSAVDSRFTYQGNSYTLASGTTATSWWIWLPNGKTITSVTDSNSSFAEIKGNWIPQTGVIVADGGSGTNSGTLYVYTNASPYTATTNLAIYWN